MNKYSIENFSIVFRKNLDDLIKNALAEDIGAGDITSLGTIPEDSLGSGRFISKATGIIAGLAAAERVFRQVNSEVEFAAKIEEGESVDTGQLVGTVQGPIRGILAAERTALNLLQRMSGIATRTNSLARMIAHTDCRLLDTRKTAPGLRLLDKWAVALGGGTNHRQGLYDMALIKDNHIAAAGNITAAVTAMHKFLKDHNKSALPIEVEVRSLDELNKALLLPIDRIMLDNMSLTEMRRAVTLAAGRIPLEASGNVTGDNIVAIAETGVDFISVGALTHSVQALDISLLIESTDSN